MKKMMALIIMTTFGLVVFGQDELHYDKMTQTFWEKDSVYISKGDTLLNVKDVEFRIVTEPVGSSITICLTNNSELPIIVRWDDVTLETPYGFHLMILHERSVIDYSKAEQSEVLASGELSIRMLISRTDDELLDMRKVVEEFSATKTRLNIECTITVPIIFNGKLVEYTIVKKGYYMGKQKKRR